MLKDIPGYPMYMVSNCGEVYSKKEKRFMKPSISKYGYARYTLYKSPNEKHKIMAHRLVAEAFLVNPNNYPQVNHKNENRLDNRVENLEWCSCSYNINYGNRNNIVREKLINFKTKTVGRKIKQIDPKTNEVVKVWDSIRQIERETGFAHSNIQSCCAGRRHTRGGFAWQYAD